MATIKKNPKTVRIDTAGSYLSAFGVNRSRSGRYSSDMQAGFILLNELQLSSLYVHNGLIRRVVDSVAEEMTRAGFKVENLDEDLQKQITARLEELNVTNKITLGLKWMRAYGGGVLVLGVNDGGNLESPINPKAVTDLEFIRVYDRFEVTVNQYYDDPADKNFGKPEIWNVVGKEAVSFGGSYRVHESRVIVFDGESLPNSIRVGNDGWGASAIQQCLTDVIRLDKSRKDSALLLERLQQAVHSIPDLSSILEEEDGAEQMQKRLQVVDAVRGAMNTIAIDGDEDYKILNSSLTGVSDIIDRNSEAVSAVSGIPMFVLYGRSVGGLNSTGDTNERAWNAKIAAMQNEKLRAAVDKIVTLLILSFSGGSSDGGDYEICFNPLSVPSENDQADIDLKREQTEKAKMETFAGYISAGVLDLQEVRKEIAEKYDIDPMELPESQEAEETPNEIVNAGGANG